MIQYINLIQDLAAIQIVDVGDHRMSLRTKRRHLHRPELKRSTAFPHHTYILIS